MALYFLEYDLRQQRDYQPLYDALKDFNAVRILKSLWCFKRINTNTEQLRDHFKHFIDPDDGLCVSEVSEWAITNTEGSPKKLP